jgi:NAD(P)-dependent dehydrogenase (short-subunit alcohol dehydrogenase family)
VQAECGPLDILVSNAGVGWPRPMAETTPLDIERVVRVNLSAAMHLTNAVVPAMVARGRGAVVIVGSVQSRVPVDPLYTATKFGLRGYALAIRRQLLGSGVTVSLVLPGNTRTAMTSHLRGRLAEPEEIARVIAGLVIHPRREAIVPGRYRAIIWLDALAPWLADALYRRRVSARRSIAGADSPRLPTPIASRGERKGFNRWKH